MDPLLESTLRNVQSILQSAQSAHARYLEAVAESVAEAVRSDVANGLLAPPLENPAGIEEALAAHAFAAARQCYVLRWGDREAAILGLMLMRTNEPTDFAEAVYLGISHHHHTGDAEARDGAALLIHSVANRSCRSLGLTADVECAHFTQVDHAFRSKAITGFGSWRSAVSADVDHRG